MATGGNVTEQAVAPRRRRSVSMASKTAHSDPREHVRSPRTRQIPANDRWVPPMIDIPTSFQLWTFRSPRAPARGRITTRSRSRLPGTSQSETFGRLILCEGLTAGSYARARVEFRLPRRVHTPLEPRHFTEGTEPSPPRSQSRKGVGLGDLGSNLCALCEKDFPQKSVITAS